MAAKTGKTKPIRLSKGERAHIRRMKQTARKDGTVYVSPNARRTPAKKSGK